jgi:hypothetical protein
MTKALREVREACRKKSRRLIKRRAECHLDPAHRTDGCGYFQNQYCYLLVDCRTVRGKPLCWVSIIDHYTGEVLLSQPCEATPDAARYGREFFIRKGRLRS